MRDAVIVDAVRTPIGRRAGALADWHAADLSAHVLTALADRSGLDPADVDDVVWGCVQQLGQQSSNIGRMSVLAAGWPESVPGTTVDRQCGSSQQAVHFAAAGIVSGQYDIAIAGGVEIMSAVPLGASKGDGNYGEPAGPRVRARYGTTPFHQGVAAEMMAQKWHLGRTQLDEFAVSSHEKLAAATDDGVFAGQLVPVPLASGIMVEDETLRRDTTVERLATLPPAFTDDGVIHAGNSSQISDGAAALLMMTSKDAKRLGLRPLARIHTAVVTGDDPVLMLSAPISATAKALDRARLSIGDVGAFEVNEAFASVPLAWLAETGADASLLNPHGGAIAMGHPLGASGARLMTTLVHHMQTSDVRYGLQTMCEGGGTANATVLERIS